MKCSSTDKHSTSLVHVFYRKNLLTCNDDEKSYQFCVLHMLKMCFTYSYGERKKNRNIWKYERIIRSSMEETVEKKLIFPGKMTNPSS